MMIGTQLYKSRLPYERRNEEIIVKYGLTHCKWSVCPCWPLYISLDMSLSQYLSIHPFRLSKITISSEGDELIVQGMCIFVSTALDYLIQVCRSLIFSLLCLCFIYEWVGVKCCQNFKNYVNWSEKFYNPVEEEDKFRYTLYIILACVLILMKIFSHVKAVSNLSNKTIKILESLKSCLRAVGI